MAAHRHWRAVALEACGTGDLELSCFHLLDAAGARVDAPATLTASIAPSTGAVANLQDDDLTTAARWAASSVAALALNWDFGGSPVDVSDIRLAGDSKPRFMLLCGVQWSDDAVTWVEWIVCAGVTYPGVATKTTSALVVLADPALNQTKAMLPFSGANESTVFTDLTGRVWTALGSAQISTAQAKYGPSSGYFDGLTAVLRTPAASNLALGLVFTVEAWVYQTARATYATVLGATTYGVTSDWLLYIDASGTLIAFDYTGAIVTSSATVSLNAWHHVEWTNDGSTSRLFIDGVLVASAPFARTPTFVIPVTVGGSHNQNVNSLFKGYIAEACITIGEAKHTAAFVPPLALSGNRPLLNRVLGRAASTDPITVGTGPTVIYGIPQVVEPVNLTAQSGAIKDYVTGVLGQGIGRVRGDTVKTVGGAEAIVSRKCRLIRERDGLQVRELWSDPVTGIYDFHYIDELQTYTVLTYDHTGAFRAVVADGQVPELMP